MAATPYPAYRASHRLKPRRPAQAQRRRVRYQARYLYRRVAAVAWPGLQGPLTGSYPVGPRKRSAAGQDIRHGTCNFAGWRLSPCPAYRVLLQAHTSQARASAAPPGKISGTVPVISPGGGCRLARPTGSSHRLIPRRPAQAQRRRA